MPTLLWLIVLSSIVWVVAERRHLRDRIQRLEERMTRGEEPLPRATVETGPPRGPVVSQSVSPPSAPAPREAPQRRPGSPDRSSPRSRTMGLNLPAVNIPALLGVVISLLGFSFLLKLAIDNGWLHLPIGTRHVLVAATGVGLIVAGWRLRAGPAAYSRTLIGGGLATLCLTDYSAVLVFRLLSGVAGFAMLLTIVGSAGVLASVLRSRTLAILGLVGGLSAPLLLPGGTVGLAEVLAYYSVFSIATLALSLRHDWPVFQLLSFCGTFGSAMLWTVWERLFGPPLGAPAELWIGVLFVVYVGVALAAGLKRDGRPMTFIDRVLVLGTPSLTLGLYAILEADGEALAVRSLLIGLVYAGCAYWLRHTHRSTTAWVQVFAAAAVAFVTLAIPLGLDGEWIAPAWATGAALQIHIAMRQRLRGYAIAAIGLLSVTALYQLTRVIDYPPAPDASSYLHPTFISGVWLAVASLLSAWWIDQRGERAGLATYWRWIPFGVGVGAWLVANGDEIARLIEGPRRIAGFIVLFAVTALLGDLTRWPMFRRFNAAYAPTLLAMLVITAFVAPHPLAEAGFIAWPLALVVLALIVRSRPGADGNLALWLMHIIGLTVAGWELHYQLAQLLDGAWPLATVTAALGIWLALATRRFVGVPVYRDKILPTAAAAVTLLLVGLQFGDGAAPPWTFVPLLNPIDLATIVALGAVIRVYGSHSSNQTPVALASVACGSMTVLRTVHHFADVPFTAAAMWGSMTAQTALTVVWALAGLAGMVGGTMRTRRSMWIAGASLMAVVVAKLFTVDLAGVNTGSRIVSFLGVGALLLAVGYFAPAPPRRFTLPAR